MARDGVQLRSGERGLRLALDVRRALGVLRARHCRHGGREQRNRHHDQHGGSRPSGGAGRPDGPGGAEREQRQRRQLGQLAGSTGPVQGAQVEHQPGERAGGDPDRHQRQAADGAERAGAAERGEPDADRDRQHCGGAVRRGHHERGQARRAAPRPWRAVRDRLRAARGRPRRARGPAPPRPASAASPRARATGCSGPSGRAARVAQAIANASAPHHATARSGRGVVTPPLPTTWLIGRALHAL